MGYSTSIVLISYVSILGATRVSCMTVQLCSDFLVLASSKMRSSLEFYSLGIYVISKVYKHLDNSRTFFYIFDQLGLLHLILPRDLVHCQL